MEMIGTNLQSPSTWTLCLKWNIWKLILTLQREEWDYIQEDPELNGWQWLWSCIVLVGLWPVKPCQPGVSLPAVVGGVASTDQMGRTQAQYGNIFPLKACPAAGGVWGGSSPYNWLGRCHSTAPTPGCAPSLLIFIIISPLPRYVFTIPSLWRITETLPLPILSRRMWGMLRVEFRPG